MYVPKGERKRGRPPSDRVRFESRLLPSRIQEIEDTAREDQRSIPDQLDYLVGLGLRVRGRVKASERKVIEEVA